MRLDGTIFSQRFALGARCFLVLWSMGIKNPTCAPSRHCSGIRGSDTAMHENECPSSSSPPLLVVENHSFTPTTDHLDHIHNLYHIDHTDRTDYTDHMDHIDHTDHIAYIAHTDHLAAVMRCCAEIGSICRVQTHPKKTRVRSWLGWHGSHPVAWAIDHKQIFPAERSVDYPVGDWWSGSGLWDHWTRP